MESNEAYSKISSVLNLNYISEYEQIIDIVLGLNADKYKGDKIVDFINIVSEWGGDEWKAVRKEFYKSYEKAKLPRVALGEMQPDLKIDIAINSQRELASYKDGSDGYYLQNACDVLRKIQPAQPTVDRHRLLISMYVSMVMGENYVTACYPPKIFLRKVVGEGVTPDQYYFSLMKVFQERESFEALAVAEAKKDPKLTKYMKSKYKEIFQTNVVRQVQEQSARMPKRRHVRDDVPSMPVPDMRRAASRIARRDRRDYYDYRSDRRDWGDRYDNRPRDMTRAGHIFLPKLSFIMVALCAVNVPMKFWILRTSTAYAAGNSGFLSAVGRGFLSTLSLIFAILCLVGAVITVVNTVSPGALQALGAVHPIIAICVPFVIMLSMFLAVLGSVSAVTGVIKIILSFTAGAVSGTLSQKNVGGLATKSTGYISRFIWTSIKSSIKRLLPFGR